MKSILPLILLCFLFVTDGFSQVISALRVDRDSILIGESVEIYYELNARQASDIQSVGFSVWNRIQSRSPNMQVDSNSYEAETEWVNSEPLSTVSLAYLQSRSKSAGANMIFRDTFHLRFWDTGVFEIPHPEIMLRDSTIELQLLQSPLLLVSYPTDLKNPDTTEVIMPLADIITEEKNLYDYIWLLYILLGLLSIFGLRRLLRSTQKKEQLPSPEKVILPAHLTAFDQLDQLEQSGLWQSNDKKQYQSQLTHIIRVYLENRFQINALEMTTMEIQNKINKLDLSKELVTSLMNVLQIADLVKFAKADPPGELHLSFLKDARSFVEKTKINMSVEEESEARQSYSDYLKALEKYNAGKI